MKKILATLLAASLLISLAACGGGSSSSSGSGGQESSVADNGSESSSESSTGGRWDALQATEESFTLYADLHESQPTINTEPTEETPVVKVVGQQIADAWLEDKPNVTVEWTRNKIMGGHEAFIEWMTLQLNADTAPDFIFAWGATFADKGWYLDLDEVIQSPNYYEPGNTCWKDMYPDYMWNDAMNVDANGHVVAIPHSVYPGPPTVYFYNKTIFNEIGIEPTTDWHEFEKNMEKVREAGYYAMAMGNLGRGSWDEQFSLGPYYAWHNRDQWDVDGDGNMTVRESTRALYNGYFYIETNPAIWEMFVLQKDKYIANLDTQGADAAQLWQDGQLAIKHDGIWGFPTENSNTGRAFDFGMMPPPVVQNSDYVDPVEFTESGPYQPQAMESFTIMKAEIQDRPSYKEDYSVDFLKYVHATENLSMLMEERQGNGIGATKTCAVPQILQDWISKSFPMKPNCSVPGASTTDGTAKINKLMEQWQLDMIDDDTFRAEYDRMLYEDLKLYMEQQQVETDDTWEEYVPASAK